MRRALFVVGIGLLAALLALFLWARSPWGRRVILSQAVRLAQRGLNGKISVGRLDGGLLRSLVLHDVRIYDREGALALEVGELRADYRLSRLLHRELYLTSLELERARVHARRLRDGRLNLLALGRGGGSSFAVRIDSLRVNGELTAPLTGRLEARGGLRWQAGDLSLQQLRAELRSDAHQLDSLEPSAQLRGPLRATLVADGSLARGFDVDLRVQPPSGELHAYAHAAVTPAGRLKWRGRADADLDPASVSARAPHGRFTLAASGSGENAAGIVELSTLALDAGRTHAHASGRLELGAHTRLDASLDGKWLRVGAARFEKLTLSAHTVDLGGRVALTGHGITLAGARLGEVRLRARGEPRGSQSWEIALDEIWLGSEAKGWTATQPGRLQVTRDQITLQLALHNGYQSLRVSGELSRGDGTLEATLSGHALDLAPLARQAAPASLRSLSGQLDWTAQAQGTFPKRAHFTLQSNAHELALGSTHLGSVETHVEGDYGDGGVRAELAAKLSGEELSGTIDGRAELRAHREGHAELHARALQLHELRFDHVTAKAEWDGALFTTHLDAAQESSGELHLEARVPADPEAPLSASLSAHDFRLALARVGGLRRLDGKLDADLRVEGPRTRARLDGTLQLAHGTVGIASEARLYEEVTVELVAHDGQLELRRLSAAAGDGKLTAHGSARLEGPRLQSIDLAADISRFPVMAGNVGAWIDAAVELHGARSGERLLGTLTVQRGGAGLPELMRRGRELQSLAPLEDVHFTDDADRERALPKPDAQVVAHIPGPFEVRSREVEADVRGQLDLVIRDGQLHLSGHAETTWGRITLFGRRYELEHARVDFDGATDDPAVDVRLTRAITGTTLVIEVHGTAQKPELVLASDPPLYDSTQVIGIVLSGDPGYPGVADNQRGALDQGSVASALSGLLVRNITDQIMPGLPLAVHVESGRAARVELGHHLTDRIYLRYTHQFGETGGGLHQVNANEASVQVRLHRRASLTVRYGDAGVGVVDVSWMLRF
jgi:autotransporter translocation and assembly factor TamB